MKVFLKFSFENYGLDPFPDCTISCNMIMMARDDFRTLKIFFQSPHFKARKCGDMSNWANCIHCFFLGGGGSHGFFMI